MNDFASLKPLQNSTYTKIYFIENGVFCMFSTPESIFSNKICFQKKIDQIIRNNYRVGFLFSLGFWHTLEIDIFENEPHFTDDQFSNIFILTSIDSLSL